MFGLKIVKEEEYFTLISHLEKTKKELDEKEGEIQKLRARVKELECSAEKPDVHTKTEGHAELITDVAESALVTDKPVKRQRRAIKKTDGDTPKRKRVVQKKD